MLSHLNTPSRYEMLDNSAIRKFIRHFVKKTLKPFHLPNRQKTDAGESDRYQKDDYKTIGISL